MWTRIYVGVFAAAVLVVGFFTYYSWGWIESIGRPEDAIAGYQYASQAAWAMLCLCSIALLFVACGVMWAGARAWALWLTFAYFAVFVGINGFWLDHGYQRLLERAAGIDTNVWATPVISVLMIIGAAVALLAIQYMIVVLRKKFDRAALPPAIDLDTENESSRLI